MPPAANENAEQLNTLPTSPGAGTAVVRYRERLNAPLWAWGVMFALALSLTVAFWIPLGMTAGVVVLVLSTLLVTWLLVSTSATIVVTQRELRVNRAHIDVDDIGLVATLDEAATNRARGQNADPRAFTVVRSLSAKESVTLEILDEEDPHPYWLISSRNPHQLGMAIRAAQDDSQHGQAPQQVQTP